MQNESPSFRYIFKAVFFVVLSLCLIGAAIDVGWFFLITVPKRAEAARKRLNGKAVSLISSHLSCSCWIAGRSTMITSPP